MDAVAARRLLRAFFPDVAAEDPIEYFGEVGSAADALVYSWLFWPKLVEMHGAVFLALNGRDETYIAERLEQSMASTRAEPDESSWTAVVYSFNFFELEYLFGVRRTPWELEEELVQQLGGALVETWSARLAAAY